MARLPSSLFGVSLCAVVLLMLAGVVVSQTALQPSPFVFTRMALTTITAVGASINAVPYSGRVFVAYIQSGQGGQPSTVYAAYSTDGINFSGNTYIVSATSVAKTVDPELLVVNGALYCFYVSNNANGQPVVFSAFFNNQTNLWTNQGPVGGSPTSVTSTADHALGVVAWKATSVPGVSGTSPSYVFVTFSTAQSGLAGGVNQSFIGLLTASSTGSTAWQKLQTSGDPWLPIQFTSLGWGEWSADAGFLYTASPQPTLTIIQKGGPTFGSVATSDYFLSSTSPAIQGTWTSFIPAINGQPFTSTSGYTSTLFSINGNPDCADLAIVAHLFGQRIIFDLYLVPLKTFTGDYLVQFNGVGLNSTIVPETLFFTNSSGTPNLFLYFIDPSTLLLAAASTAV